MTIIRQLVQGLCERLPVATWRNSDTVAPTGVFAGEGSLARLSRDSSLRSGIDDETLEFFLFHKGNAALMKVDPAALAEIR
jgi:hypothetical protein